MSFNISVNKLSNQTSIFLYQNIAIKKTGEGPGGDGRGNSQDLKIFEKTGGGRDQCQYREDFAKSTSMMRSFFLTSGEFFKARAQIL